MKIIQRYQFYKRALQVTFAINIFFVLAGVWALKVFLANHDISASAMIVVGFGTFVFGLFLPLYFLRQFMKTMAELRRHTEQAIAQWVGGWLENYRNHHGDALRDPHFWLNIALLSAEVFGEQSNHPVSRFVREFAPMIRTEMGRQRTTATSHSASSDSPKRRAKRPAV